MSTPIRVVLSLALMAIGVYGAYSIVRVLNHRQPLPGATISLTRSLDDFTFTDSNGQPYNMGQLKDKNWVASFFFINCPSFCAQMNAQTAQLSAQYADQDVKFVCISVDPANDTPERLHEYAKRFNADPRQMIFLTGKFEDTYALGQGVFQISVMGQQHSDRYVIVDAEGKVRGRYQSMDPRHMESFHKTLQSVTGQPSAPVSTEAPVPAEATPPAEVPMAVETPAPQSEQPTTTEAAP